MQKKVEVIHHVIYPNNFGGVGIMATHTDGDSFIRIATEPCSSHDQYSKKIACALLATSFLNNEVIRVPINKRRNVTHREVRDMVIGMFA